MAAAAAASLAADGTDPTESVASPLPPPPVHGSGAVRGRGSLSTNSRRGLADVSPPPFSTLPPASSSTRPLLPLFSSRSGYGHGRLPTAVSQTEGFNKESLLFPIIACFLVGTSIFSPDITRGWTSFFKACYVLLVLSGLIIVGARIFVSTASAGAASYSTQLFMTVASKALLIISLLVLVMDLAMLYRPCWPWMSQLLFWHFP